MIRSFFSVLFSFAIAFIVTANNSYVYAQDACDPNFNTVMEARATAEAMRELEMAQHFILKPDSVLEYSCFNNAVVRISNSDIFSDAVLDANLFELPPQMYVPGGPYPGYLPTIDDTQVTAPNYNANFRVQPGADAPGGALTAFDLDTTLSDVVLYTLLEHLNVNFGHVFAGGFLSTPSASVCNAMQLVWNYMRCDNFNKTSFYTFMELSVLDPRVVPSYPPLNCNDPNRATLWSAAIAAANPAPGATGGVAPVVTHVDQFASSCSGVEPIPTGVRVFDGSPPVEVFDDAVCLAAGCHYNRTTGNCEP